MANFESKCRLKSWSYYLRVNLSAAGLAYKYPQRKWEMG